MDQQSVLNDKQFNIHYQWKQYLERCQVREQDLPEVQQIEMKKCFYGGCAQMLLLVRDELGDILEKLGPAVGQPIAMIVYETMINQCLTFWEMEAARHNIMPK